MDFHISQFLSPGRKEFVKGTLLLTGAGLFCRVLGFLPDLHVTYHRGRRSGTLQYDPPAVQYCLCGLRLFPSRRLCPSIIAASQEKGPTVLNAVCSCL